MKPFVRFVAVVLCVCLLLCSCGPGNEVDPNAPKGSIKLAILQPDHLHPLRTQYATNQTNLSFLFDTLVSLDADLNITPSLAESWTFSEDGLQCRLTLKNGVTFHDGTALTASDVVDCMDKIFENENSIYHRLVNYVASYHAVGTQQVEVDLSVPGSCFLTYMAFPVVKKGTEFVGTGPYKVLSHDDNSLTAQAYSGNGHTPRIETVRVLYYPRLKTLTYGFLSYESDAISVSVADLGSVSERTAVESTEYLSDSFLFLGFNTDSYLFSDVNLRKAVAYALDKEDFVKTAMANHGKAATSPYKPDTVYSDLFGKDYTADEEQVAACLQAGSYNAEDFGFSVLVNEEDPAKIQAADYICKQLNALGIPAYVRAYPYDMYRDLIASGDYLSFIGEINMEQDYNLNFLLRSTGNYFNFVNEDLDAALDAFVAATDDSQKKEQAKTIQGILYESVPLISLCYKTNILLTDPKIQGTFSPKANQPFFGLESWTVKDAEKQ